MIKIKTLKQLTEFEKKSILRLRRQKGRMLGTYKNCKIKNDENCYIVIARTINEVYGWALLRFLLVDLKIVCDYQVYVKRKHRGKQIGTNITKTAFEFAKNNNADVRVWFENSNWFESREPSTYHLFKKFEDNCQHYL